MEMNADNSQLLSQLKDIHSAGDPGWWPPAPGWWVLGLLLLLVLSYLFRILANKLAVIRRRRAWLRELNSLSRQFDPVEKPREYLAALNTLFRAVALKAFPETGCARLQGEEWTGFIVSLMPENASSQSLFALARGPYQALPEFDADALNQQARTWVKLYG